MGASACPKCGTARGEGATACSKCGLATDRMDGFARAQAANIPDVLGVAWQRAVDHWSEPPHHEEVLRLVAQHDAYAWAATQYRSRAGDPIADKQLERIRKSAEVTMLSAKAARTDKYKNPYRNTLTLLIMLVVVVVGGLIYAWARSRGADPTPPTTTIEVK